MSWVELRSIFVPVVVWNSEASAFLGGLRDLIINRETGACMCIPRWRVPRVDRHVPLHQLRRPRTPLSIWSHAVGTIRLERYVAILVAVAMQILCKFCERHTVFRLVPMDICSVGWVFLASLTGIIAGNSRVFTLKLKKLGDDPCSRRASSVNTPVFFSL